MNGHRPPPAELQPAGTPRNETAGRALVARAGCVGEEKSIYF